MESEIEKLQELVNQITAECSPCIQILEAGCGDQTHIDFGQKAHITGIDISEMQLSRNQEIDERIVGDIQSYEFPASSFDIIICWNVLEHVRNPAAALNRFSNATKQGGIIILAVPNVYSIKGLLTKYTPHLFHVWAYKYIFGIADAGKDDNAPFRTILSYSISPGAIREFAAHHGLKVLYFASYDTEFYVRRLGPLFSRFKQFIKLVTNGRLGDSDLVMALQKE